MADQIKQIAFREFTTVELQAGTPWNAIQSGANDAYVVKSIEATNGANTNVGAIIATATVGLTTDFNNGKYVNIGTIAQKDRLGVSGNLVVDANSTLTVRPVAKTISFEDKIFHVDTENATQPRKTRQELRGSVIGVQDISTSTSIDKTSVSMSHTNSYQGGSSAYSYQHTIFHTNANGVELKMLFTVGNSSTSTFEIHNAATGTQFGRYQTSYGTAYFDGERYIYWHDEGTNKIRYFDTDETTTNLSSSNTYGGGNNASYYHGIINFSGTAPSGSNTSYDNHFAGITSHNGKTYFFWSFGTQYYLQMAELPSTLTNYNATANVCPKWVRLWNGNSTNQTTNFGQTGMYSMGALKNNIGYNYQGSVRVTHDDDLGRWLVYYNPNTVSNIFVGTFTQAELDATSDAGVIAVPNGGSGYGLICLEESEINTHLKIDSKFTNTYSSQGIIEDARIYNNIKPNGDSWSIPNSGSRYFDGRKAYFSNAASAAGFEWHVYECDLANDTGTDITAGFSGNIPNYYGRFYMVKTTPSASTIAGRSYPSAPKLTVRLSGVHEDRS
jgi:hypothetical protein